VIATVTLFLPLPSAVEVGSPDFCQLCLPMRLVPRDGGAGLLHLPNRGWLVISPPVKNVCFWQLFFVGL
jgi:hypothetical protein